MKTYVVEGVPARIGAGTLVGLTKDQYATRVHNIEGAEKGDGGLMIGRAKVPLEFKVGEKLMIEGEEPKSIVNPLTSEPMSKPARRRAASDAAKKRAGARK